MTNKRKLNDSELRECALLKSIYDSKKRSLGITQAELAHEWDISQGAVASYLTGRNALNIKIAYLFADALKVQVEDFSPRLAKEISDISTGTPLTDQEREIVLLLKDAPDWLKEQTRQLLKGILNNS